MIAKPFWYAVAAVMGAGFWAWVGGAAAVGIVKKWWREQIDAPKHEEDEDK